MMWSHEKRNILLIYQCQRQNKNFHRIRRYACEGKRSHSHSQSGIRGKSRSAQTIHTPIQTSANQTHRNPPRARSITPLFGWTVEHYCSSEHPCRRSGEHCSPAHYSIWHCLFEHGAYALLHYGKYVLYCIYGKAMRAMPITKPII